MFDEREIEADAPSVIEAVDPCTLQPSRVHQRSLENRSAETSSRNIVYIGPAGCILLLLVLVYMSPGVTRSLPIASDFTASNHKRASLISPFYGKDHASSALTGTHMRLSEGTTLSFSHRSPASFPALELFTAHLFLLTSFEILGIMFLLISDSQWHVENHAPWYITYQYAASIQCSLNQYS